MDGGGAGRPGGDGAAERDAVAQPLLRLEPEREDAIEAEALDRVEGEPDDGARGDIPALLTSTSTRPKRSITSATTARTCSPSRTSQPSDAPSRPASASAA